MSQGRNFQGDAHCVQVTVAAAPNLRTAAILEASKRYPGEGRPREVDAEKMVK